MIAGFLVTMGTLGDRIGRRRLLLTGASAFGIASAMAAFATSAEMLIATRALLGIAGATLMPSTLSLLRNMFQVERERTLAHYRLDDRLYRGQSPSARWSVARCWNFSGGVRCSCSVCQ